MPATEGRRQIWGRECEATSANGVSPDVNLTPRFLSEKGNSKGAMSQIRIVATPSDPVCWGGALEYLRVDEMSDI